MIIPHRDSIFSYRINFLDRGLFLLKYQFYLTFSYHIIIKGRYYREVKYVEE